MFSLSCRWRCYTCFLSPADGAVIHVFSLLQMALLYMFSLSCRCMALSQILPSLFLSGASVAEDAPLVSRSGITLIVNATLCHAPAPPPGVEVLRVPVSDLPTARLDRHFDRVAERIHGNRAGNTLVHCAAGMSRSPTLVMAYLMRFRGATLSQAHTLVRDKRPHVYERRLYGRNSVRLAEEREEPRPQAAPVISIINSNKSIFCSL
uniref:Si:ch1073-184j22.2 n=1 Tax=Neogobius melanostomus TaxID=47308 RepID=A0A8C6T1A1_9GOBI